MYGLQWQIEGQGTLIEHECPWNLLEGKALAGLLPGPGCFPHGDMGTREAVRDPPTRG
jgi:hypothetical protein